MKEQGDIEVYAGALIGVVENALDRGAFNKLGTAAIREIIKRLQVAIRKEKTL